MEPTRLFGASTNEDDSIVSDCESAVSRVQHDQHGVLEQQGFFLRLGEDDVIHDLIKRRFLQGLGLVGTETEVVAIHRNACCGVMAQARVQCFQVYAQAVAKLRDGNANVKYGWYGTCGEEEISDIVSHGFGHDHGHQLCLSPDDSPLPR